mmetsp:Transcript_14344/g.33392  ORF Transcript_14344/g.33392 Transcript_14344/m.33392 type:complete len:256 (+) Transcript_14344:245-1012(+)
MSKFIRTCPDGHRCENGSSCAEHPFDEGKYYCDCGTSNGDFAGLFCEYAAETYCQLPQETTSDWFCTNQGTCVLSTDGPETQWNCDCPANFDGSHCQFIQGNIPRDWPGYDFDPSTGELASSPQFSSRKNNIQRKPEGGLHIAVSIFIGLVVFFILALLVFSVVRKLRNKDGNVAQNATRDPSEGLKLEADGSVLQEVMQSFARTPNSTVNGDQGTFDVSIADRSSDDYSIEIGANGYTDHQRHGENGRSNGNIL